jgi:nucleoid DNA-binding protein
MAHNYNYQKIWDAFTNAASPVVAEAAFDSIRSSLNNGHEVRISLSEGEPISFSNIGDFEEWVQDTFYDTGEDE